MSLIKQIEDLKSGGKSDSDIVSTLRSQGYMPREIEDALSQFQVKSAVSQEYSMDPSMQQSIMSAPAPAPQGFSPPAPQANQQDNYYQQESSQGQYDYSQGYSQEGSQQYPQYSYSAPSSESISEVAEQVFDQKIAKIKSELSRIDDFKSDTEGKVNLLKERIKRIESIIDTLQDSIIRKIGEYGENIQELGKDLRATQDSFAKVVAPLTSSAKSKSARPRRKRKK
jgi:hypothetical protein